MDLIWSIWLSAFENSIYASYCPNKALASFIRQMGKKAIHLGGILQLFFGIHGKAWNSWNVYNKYWTSPKNSERPKGYLSVETGRY